MLHVGFARREPRTRGDVQTMFAAGRMSHPHAIMRAMRSTIDLAATAREHLTPQVADTWIGLLQLAIQLTGEVDEGSVVGYLGGEPELPESEPWPHWPEVGPLSLVATLDCAALPSVPGLALPVAGTLLFFYFDGQYDDCDALVYCGDPASKAGATVVYVPDGTLVAQRSTPEGLQPYPRVPLRAATVDTAPGYDHFTTRDAFPQMAEVGYDHPVCADDFVDALDLGFHFGHQVGGHALPIQGPVEYEVAQFALGGVDWHTPELRTEARRWRLLAQFTSDHRADMMWGDAGTLYWLITLEDLEARRFDNALFTWQCS